MIGVVLGEEEERKRRGRGEEEERKRRGRGDASQRRTHEDRRGSRSTLGRKDTRRTFLTNELAASDLRTRDLPPAGRLLLCIDRLLGSR
ncbi:hypothetical protein EYF80_064665 [Liparis tanakae]|uniref:Uncharacterized protein n=1 Tax=Liparis tanakae TaxID=230148 RepID=A0A4Z2E8R5_9TELE|nr:hypothetical protein EYF80_064665 [Liparis tanakae]